MKKLLLITFVMLSLLSCSSNDDENVPSGNESADGVRTYVEKAVLNADGSIAIPSEYRAMNEKNNDFTWRIFNYVASQKAAEDGSNMVISPYSLAVDLAMLNNGVAGDSQSELKQFLAFGDYSVDDINDYFAVLTRGLLKEDASTIFTSANAMWYDTNFSIKKAFSSTLESWYKAETHAAEMKSQQTLNDINKWVSDNTNGMIEKIFESVDEIPDASTLLNAIYLKSPWKSEFDSYLSRNDDFFLSDGTAVTVKYMHDCTEFSYAKGNKESVVFLPLGENGMFDMFFALPESGVSVAAAVADLQSSWTAICSAAVPTEVILNLPRFSTEYEYKWEDCLASMGCTKIFSPMEADLSNMTDAKNAYVSKIKQKTNITVNEGGVECAATTGTGILTSGGDSIHAVDLSFNRPFVFGLREKSTGVILFVGCVNNPL